MLFLINCVVYQINVCSIVVIENGRNLLELCDNFIVTCHISGQNAAYDAFTYLSAIQKKKKKKKLLIVHNKIELLLEKLIYMDFGINGYL